jgi:predicted DCC family thiol-disulfide oxidoreductase YuxK
MLDKPAYASCGDGTEQGARPSENAPFPIDRLVILFDAECVLCSANARFILERDHAAVFRLASMQGEVGQRLYRRHGMDPADPATMLVIEGERMRRDSDAVLSIYERLGYPWKLLTVLRIVPAALRDPVYRLVARNRYRLFGRRTSCWVAPATYRDRIL